MNNSSTFYKCLSANKQIIADDTASTILYSFRFGKKANTKKLKM